MKKFDKILSMIAMVCLTCLAMGCLVGACFNLDFFLYAKYLIGIPIAVLIGVASVVATRSILK